MTKGKFSVNRVICRRIKITIYSCGHVPLDSVQHWACSSRSAHWNPLAATESALGGGGSLAFVEDDNSSVDYSESVSGFNTRMPRSRGVQQRNRKTQTVSIHFGKIDFTVIGGAAPWQTPVVTTLCLYQGVPIVLRAINRHDHYDVKLGAECSMWPNVTSTLFEYKQQPLDTVSKRKSRLIEGFMRAFNENLYEFDVVRQRDKIINSYHFDEQFH